MADWEAKQLREIIQDINDKRIVLPVIQRRLVWDEEKMTALFESLLKKNAFGGVICIKEIKGRKPLFEFREFSVDGEPRQSVSVEALEHDTLFVIDGQQRLQSFYIGLAGTYNGRSMYFDICSDYDNEEFDFKFAASSYELLRVEFDLFDNRKCFWYSTRRLFDELVAINDARKVARGIATKFDINNEDVRYLIEDNINRFYEVVIKESTIGLSKVAVNRDDSARSKRKIVEMFRVLNNGGTVLMSYDLMASTLKGFDARMERLLDELTDPSLGLNQDNLIKLLIILFGDPIKEREISDLTEAHAKSAVENEARIKFTLDVLKKFLEATQHLDWFSSTRKKSHIPIYFLAYHIFHKYSAQSIEDIDALISSDDFRAMRNWLHFSLLNSAFVSGCGWKPTTTGLNEIYKVMRDHKGKDFPLHSLYSLYQTRLHKFNENIRPDTIDAFDKDYAMYLMYDCQAEYLIFPFERDHIHPKKLVGGSKRVDSLGNFELLTRSDNRLKKDSELVGWLNEKCPSKSAKDAYLGKHLIPKDENLWRHERFEEFLDARLQSIAEKLARAIES